MASSSYAGAGSFAEDTTLPFQLSHNLARLSSQQQQQQQPSVEYGQQQQPHGQGQPAAGGFGGVDDSELFASWSQFAVAGVPGPAGGSGSGTGDGSTGPGRTSLKVPFFRWCVGRFSSSDHPNAR